MTTLVDPESPAEVVMRMINESIAYINAVTLAPTSGLLDTMLAEPPSDRQSLSAAFRSILATMPKIPDSPWVDRIGWFGIGFLALVLLPTWPLAALGVVLVAVSVRMARLIAQGAAERRRLIADCDAQHAALMGGDDVCGVFGRFPVPALVDEPEPQSDLSAALSELADELNAMGEPDLERAYRIDCLKAKVEALT